MAQMVRPERRVMQTKRPGGWDPGRCCSSDDLLEVWIARPRRPGTNFVTVRSALSRTQEVAGGKPPARRAPGRRDLSGHPGLMCRVMPDTGWVSTARLVITAVVFETAIGSSAPTARSSTQSLLHREHHPGGRSRGHTRFAERSTRQDPLGNALGNSSVDVGTALHCRPTVTQDDPGRPHRCAR